MTFRVLVVPCEGQFTAALVGAPEVRVVGSTRGEAIAAIKAEITDRMGRGELVGLEVSPVGIADLAGTYVADPSLRQICTDAYRDRDAELHQ